MDVVHTHRMTQRLFADAHRHEREVARWLSAGGFAVRVTKQRIAPTFRDRHKYTDGGVDIDVIHPNGGHCPLNPKQAWGISFTSKHNIPTDWGLFISTVSSWKRSTRKPLAVPITCVFTGVTLVVPVLASIQHWLTVHDVPGPLEYREPRLACPAVHLITWDEFIVQLKREGY